MQLKLTEPTCPRLADLKDQAKQRTHHDERPAYPGAKFNMDGLCTRHATIRLCRVTNAGTYKKYQILHKVCSKCDTTTTQQQNSSLRAARDYPSRHSERNLLRYEKRAQGGIVSRTTPSGESTDSKDESRVALEDPPSHHRKWERRSRLKGRNGEVMRSRRKHSRPRKIVVRKQSSMTKEGDDDTSSMSPLVEDIIKDITITAPLKDLPSVNIEKNDVHQQMMMMMLLSQHFHYHSALNWVVNHRSCRQLIWNNKYVIYLVYSSKFKWKIVPTNYQPLFKMTTLLHLLESSLCPRQILGIRSVMMHRQVISTGRAREINHQHEE